MSIYRDRSSIGYCKYGKFEEINPKRAWYEWSDCMRKGKLSKAERQKNREIVGRYHKKVTEKELQGLFEDFLRWKNGEMPYYDLTDKIHEFHKLNQKIWSKFNFNGWDDFLLVLEAKKELDLLTDEEKNEFSYWLRDE